MSTNVFTFTFTITYRIVNGISFKQQQLQQQQQQVPNSCWEYCRVVISLLSLCKFQLKHLKTKQG